MTVSDDDVADRYWMVEHPTGEPLSTHDTVEEAWAMADSFGNGVKVFEVVKRRVKPSI